MIDALQQLKSNLEAKPTRGRSYEIISYIVDACLQRDDVYEKLTSNSCSATSRIHWMAHTVGNTGLPAMQ